MVIYGAALFGAFRGFHWARIILLVFVALAAISTTVSFFVVALPEGVHLERDWVATGIAGGLLLIRMLGVGLLFTPSANAWYRPHARTR
jgi:predicted Abi (CAAX) family protease